MRVAVLGAPGAEEQKQAAGLCLRPIIYNYFVYYQ